LFLALALEDDFASEVFSDGGGCAAFGAADEEWGAIQVVFDGDVGEVEAAGGSIAEVGGLEV
jgi:hypothetical protein